MSTTEFLDVSLSVDPEVVEMNKTKKRKEPGTPARGRKMSGGEVGVGAGVDLVKRKRGKGK